MDGPKRSYVLLEYYFIELERNYWKRPLRHIPSRTHPISLQNVAHSYQKDLSQK